MGTLQNCGSYVAMLLLIHSSRACSVMIEVKLGFFYLINVHLMFTEGDNNHSELHEVYHDVE
jgi:hypothetical protein